MKGVTRERKETLKPTMNVEKTNSKLMVLNKQTIERSWEMLIEYNVIDSKVM